MKKSAFMFITNDAMQFVKRLKGSKEYKGSFYPARAMKRLKLEKALDELRAKAYTKIGELACTAYVTDEPLPFENRFDGTKKVIKTGTCWAEKTFDCAWFHITGLIPADAPKDRIVYLIDVSGEGLVYDKDGTPKQGITCYASQFDYRLGLPVKKVVLDKNLSCDGVIEFFIDCGANDLFGNFKNKSAVQQLDIAVVNPSVRSLAYDIEVLLSVYDFNEDDSFTKGILDAVSDILSGCKDITEDNAFWLREKLLPYLTAANDKGAFQYSAIGHAHLDLAWLWPIRETKRKGARTFTNQLINIERYPDYLFGASQAQLYQWIKEEYSGVYEQVKKSYADGRWELQGATWVEPDTNLISGESLVRQFYYGLKYFLTEFGEHMRILWLPDSFGYSACIPQVMKLANVPYFLTQKMSWNTVNKFPYHTFNWRGLDGSTVFAHMLPESTYNAPARGDFLKAGEKNYAERKISNDAVSLFGIGDGGGGPGFEHIERADRLRDIKGMPKYKQQFVKTFFDTVSREAEKYPVYGGELYLEKHQGTYTTQSHNKKMNRRCEFRLRDYEMLAAAAGVGGLELPISRDEVDKIWKEVLLYQFHDILPGSSINRVYDETRVRYADIIARLTSGIDILLNGLVKGRGVANLNSFPYDKPLKINDIWYRIAVPPMGCTGIKPEKAIERFEARVTENTIENDSVKLTFKDGFIVSLYDKTLGKEFVRKGKRLNLYTMYKDFGNCWDIMPKNYKRLKRNVSCESFKTGTDGAKAFAIVQYSVGANTIKQEINILDGSPLVTFDTDIDFFAKSSMLRVAFPLDIKTDECKFNVQFGHIARKTTENDSFDKAKFEVSGQKFVDMSDKDVGLSLINNCKYGYRCKHGVIDMNMIRSPLMGPGTEVDRGHSHFRYAVLPHKGALSWETYKEAYHFNSPPSIIMNGIKAAEDRQNFFSDNSNIIVEAVKASDDGEGIIARVYNCSESSQSVKLSARGFALAFTTDILENPLESVSGRLEFGAFELKCLKFVKEI